VTRRICFPPRDTSSHQDSAAIAPSGTPPPAQPFPRNTAPLAQQSAATRPAAPTHRVLGRPIQDRDANLQHFDSRALWTAPPYHQQKGRMRRNTGGCLGGPPTPTGGVRLGLAFLSNLAFTRYCHCQYCMVYGNHKRGRVGGRILRIRRALVLQSCEQCR